MLKINPSLQYRVRFFFNTIFFLHFSTAMLKVAEDFDTPDKPPLSGIES